MSTKPDLPLFVEDSLRISIIGYLLELMQHQGWTPAELGEKLGWQPERFGAEESTFAEWLGGKKQPLDQCIRALEATRRLRLGRPVSADDLRLIPHDFSAPPTGPYSHAMAGPPQWDLGEKGEALEEAIWSNRQRAFINASAALVESQIIRPDLGRRVQELMTTQLHRVEALTRIDPS